MGPTATSFVLLDGGFSRAAWTRVRTMGGCLFLFFVLLKKTKQNSSCNVHLWCYYNSHPTSPSPPKFFTLKKNRPQLPVSVSPLEGLPAFHQITAARLNILYLIKDSSSRAIQTERGTRVMKRAQNTRSHRKAAHLAEAGLSFCTFSNIYT